MSRADCARTARPADGRPHLAQAAVAGLASAQTPSWTPPELAGRLLSPDSSAAARGQRRETPPPESRRRSRHLLAAPPGRPFPELLHLKPRGFGAAKSRPGHTPARA